MYVCSVLTSYCYANGALKNGGQAKYTAFKNVGPWPPPSGSDALGNYNQQCKIFVLKLFLCSTKYKQQGIFTMDALQNAFFLSMRFSNVKKGKTFCALLFLIGVVFLMSEIAV